MKITIIVKPNRKKQSIKRDGNNFIIELKSQPIDNQANKELIEILSDYFKIPKKNIKIIAGANSRKKIIEIMKE